MNKFKSYIGNFAPFVLAPGATIFSTNNIVNMARRSFLRNILWNIKLTNLTTGQVNNLNLNTDIFYSVTILNIAGAVVPLGLPIVNVAPPALSVADKSISLFEPGEYYFDGVYFQNELRLNFYFANFSLVNTYQVQSHYTFEIEESDD